MKRKPPGYWLIKKNVINDAKKYDKRVDWKRNSPGAYQSAFKNNWVNECRKYIKWVVNAKYGYWQDEKRVIKDAKKYKTIGEWQKNSPAAYQSARKNGWFETCSRHMERKRGKWLVKKDVINDAKQYNTRKEWRINSSGAYQSALKNGWLKECYAPKAQSVVKRSDLAKPDLIRNFI